MLVCQNTGMTLIDTPILGHREYVPQPIYLAHITDEVLLEAYETQPHILFLYLLFKAYRPAADTLDEIEDNTVKQVQIADTVCTFSAEQNQNLASLVRDIMVLNQRPESKFTYTLLSFRDLPTEADYNEWSRLLHADLEQILAICGKDHSYVSMSYMEALCMVNRNSKLKVLYKPLRANRKPPPELFPGMHMLQAAINQALRDTYRQKGYVPEHIHKERTAHMSIKWKKRDHKDMIERMKRKQNGNNHPDTGTAGGSEHATSD